jgi:hypothetical protein
MTQASSASDPAPAASSGADTGTSVEVLRFDIGSIVDMRQTTGIDGEFVWPYPPLHLAALFKASSEHSRAIVLKAEGAFGRGLIGQGADVLDKLCDGGAAELFTGLGIDLECYGNAFLQVVTGSGGRVVQLRRLPAITMSRYRSGFLQRVPLPNGDLRRVTFSDAEILHLKDHSISGRNYGEPSWIGAQGMLELTQAAVRFNAAFFENGAMPEYAVIFEGGTPTAADKAAVKSFFVSEYKGVANAHRTLVLHHLEQQKIRFEKLTADVKDGDFLKLLDAARDRIITAHGVPPRMLGIMSAGQLGGGGEITGQMFVFEHLTLAPRRARMMARLQPILTKLGLKAVKPEDADATPGNVAFQPLDLTPPDQDIPPLADLVAAGILSAEEAYAVLPLSARPEKRDGKAAPVPTQKSEAGAIELLAALLARS